MCNIIRSIIRKERENVTVEILEDPVWSENFKSIVDFGCGKMGLFERLRRLSTVEKILNVDINEKTLEDNLQRVKPLHSDFLKERDRPLYVGVFKGNLIDSVEDVKNIDVVLLLEVIQELDPDDLNKMPENIFGFIQPKLCIMSTPNHDYIKTRYRPQRNHNFEWNQIRFEIWAQKICDKYKNYTFYLLGADRKRSEFATLMALFVRNDINKLPLVKPIEDLKPDESAEYKKIYEVEYPCNIDRRTNKEKIEHKINEYLGYISNNSNIYFDENAGVYRIPSKPLLEFANEIGASSDEVDFVLKEKKFCIENDIFTVSENFMAAKYSSLTEYDDDLLSYVPYRGWYNSNNNDVNNNVVPEDDVDEENWD